MKKAMASIFCGLVLVLAVAYANAATISLELDDEYYVGLVNPGLPSSEFDDFLDTLLAMPLDSGPTLIDGNYYTRSDLTPLPDPEYPGVKIDSGTAPEIFVGSTLYIMGKYDGPNAGSAVWYVGGLDPLEYDKFTIPQDFVGTQYAISHYVLWGGGEGLPPIPEPSTLFLLGSGVLGLGILGRKRLSK